MKNNTVAIIVIVALGLGYFAGTSSVGMATTSKDMDDAILMMKKQSASIEKMGGIMMSSGKMMQEMGEKYNDDTMMSQGKDLEAVGGQYVKENVDAVSGSGSMNRMMGR